MLDLKINSKRKNNNMIQKKDMAMENNYFLHANAFSKFHFADHNDTERH